MSTNWLLRWAPHWHRTECIRREYQALVHSLSTLAQVPAQGRSGRGDITRLSHQLRILSFITVEIEKGESWYKVLLLLLCHLTSAPRHATLLAVTLYPCKTTVESGGRVSHSAERSVDTVSAPHSVCHPVLVSPPWVQTYR